MAQVADLAELRFYMAEALSAVAYAHAKVRTAAAPSNLCTAVGCRRKVPPPAPPPGAGRPQGWAVRDLKPENLSLSKGLSVLM